jgi:hypothetical protein
LSQSQRYAPLLINTAGRRLVSEKKSQAAVDIEAAGASLVEVDFAAGGKYIAHALMLHGRDPMVSGSFITSGPGNRQSADQTARRAARHISFPAVPDTF